MTILQNQFSQFTLNQIRELTNGTNERAFNKVRNSHCVQKYSGMSKELFSFKKNNPQL